MNSNLIITCPVCGYTFRNENLRIKKKKIVCPMCSYQFKESKMHPERLDEFLI
ncbi:MAG: hypothetical protein ACFFFY_10580 [Promethearchaeota archaeon]